MGQTPVSGPKKSVSGTGHPLTPATFKVPVAGGNLHVARWGAGPYIVLGVHGVTASCMSLLPVARRLGPSSRLSRRTCAVGATRLPSRGRSG